MPTDAGAGHLREVPRRRRVWITVEREGVEGGAGSAYIETCAAPACSRMRVR